jgi:hypothetical protein
VEPGRLELAGVADRDGPAHPRRAPWGGRRDPQLPGELRVGVGPAAPVIGVAAAGEPGPGGAPPLGVAGGPAARGGRGAGCTVRPGQRTTSPPYPGPGDRGQHGLASDTGQVPAPRQVGIPVDVGTDEAASNANQNMLEAAKAAAILQKLTRLDARALTAGDILAKATVEGA